MARSGNVASFLVEVDGITDVDATVAAFREDVESYLAAQDAASTVVVECLNNVFDDEGNFGKRIPQSFIINSTIQRMTALDSKFGVVSMYPVLVKMVTGVIQEQVKAGVLNSARGPGGGCSRSCDLPAKEPKTSK